MKWLVIIVILVLIVAGMLWLRMARQGSGTARPRNSHRLDDSVIPPASPGTRPDIPSPATAAGVAAEGARDATEEPRSDVAWEPETTGSEEPGRPDDLPPSETRPGA